MKKWIFAILLLSLVGCTVVDSHLAAVNQAISPDQSAISGRLVESELVYKEFVFTSPHMDFHQKVLKLTLLPNGVVKSKDTIVNRWDIGPNNTLRFYLVDDVRASFSYDSRAKALVATPFIVHQQAHIKMWVSN